MKMNADRLDGANAISRHGPEGIVVNGAEIRHHVIVPWQGAVQRWDVAGLEALEPAAFEPIAALQPELVIFGSGAKLRFLRPALYAPLMARRIGFETMDTAAACRTYNVLLAEGRTVVAALLFTPAG